MKEVEVQIINKLGLHVRAATQLVQLAASFDAEISLTCNGQTADAKSIMDVLMLAGTINSILHIQATGIDSEEEAQVIKKLSDLINNRFNEKE